MFTHPATERQRIAARNGGGLRVPSTCAPYQLQDVIAVFFVAKGCAASVDLLYYT